jgi:hypothetical protein
MKKGQGKVEIPESILRRWWWRRLVFLDFDEVTHTTKLKLFVPEYPSYGFVGEWSMWHSKDELIAFRYELLRRTGFSDLPEWHAVPVWLGGWILGVIAPKTDHFIGGRREVLLNFFRCLSAKKQYNVGWIVFNETLLDVSPKGRFDLIEHAHMIQGPTATEPHPLVSGVFGNAVSMSTTGEFGVGHQLPDIDED